MIPSRHAGILGVVCPRLYRPAAYHSNTPISPPNPCSTIVSDFRRANVAAGYLPVHLVPGPQKLVHQRDLPWN